MAQPNPATPQTVEAFTVYELDFAALASAGVGNGAIQIQADSAFRWTKATYSANIAAAAFLSGTRPIPNVTIQITDNGSGRQLFNNPVPIPNIMGSGELPFILPMGYVFEPKSSMQVQVTNFDAVVTYNLRLSFIGTKIFKL